MEQVAKRSCAVSILGGFQDATVQSCEQSSLISELTLLWAGVWTKDILRSLPTQVILWCYDIWLQNLELGHNVSPQKKGSGPDLENVSKAMFWLAAEPTHS